MIGNTVTNTKGLYPAFIAVNGALEDPNYVWGTGIDSVEVRNNSITGRPGTPPYDMPYDGYYNNFSFSDPEVRYFSPNASAPGILGTIFQGNNCTNCTTFYTLGASVSDTILWNSRLNGATTPAVQTPVIKNIIWTNTGPAGTVVGHD